MFSPYMIAVTGGSGSGKSTLSQVLQRKLGEDQVLVFTEDAYYRPREAHGEDAPLWSPAEMEARVNFDDPASKDMDLYETHLAALRRGESVIQPYYDFALHDRIMGRETTITPCPIIVAEGVHVLSRNSLFDLFDLTVFVDTPPDIRLARRILRDVRDRGREVERVIAQYLTFVRAAHAQYTEPFKMRCDIIIQDEGPLAMSMGQPDLRAEDRLAAPVLSFLKDESVI